MMRGFESDEPRRYLARWARWIGFDGNPLRRGTDRIEAAIRLAMVILLVVAVPVTAVFVGQLADHVALHRAHVQQAADHLVTAVLLQQAPATGVPDPYGSIQYAPVLARWQPPGLPARSGTVLAPAGARKGSTVQTWIGRNGAITSPPVDHREITGQVCIAVVLTWLVSSLGLLALQTLALRALDRRRLSAWAAEWDATGPLWSGRHQK